MESLTSLQIESNAFHGDIPSSFCNLRKLDELTLCNSTGGGCSNITGVPGCLLHMGLSNLAIGNISIYYATRSPTKLPTPSSTFLWSSRWRRLCAAYSVRLSHTSIFVTLTLADASLSSALTMMTRRMMTLARKMVSNRCLLHRPPSQALLRRSNPYRLWPSHGSVDKILRLLL